MIQAAARLGRQELETRELDGEAWNIDEGHAR